MNETSGTTAIDSVGTSNGTYTSVTLGSTAITGDTTASALFNGTSSYMTTPIADPNGASTSNPWTVEIVVKPSGSGGVLMANADSADYGYGFLVYDDSGTLLVFNGNTSCASSPTLSTGTVYVVALTYDGTTCKTYVDGVAEGSGTGTYSPTSGTTTVVGYNPRAGANYLSGNASSFAIYPTALSQATLAANYAVLNTP